VYGLVYSAASQRDIEKIRRYITMKSSARVAANYLDALAEFCGTLCVSPHRGQERAHVRKGLRSVGFKRRVSVIFSVSEKQQTVRIARFWYAGYQGKSE
jgi:plasmid stabilization system protein ParE